MDIVKEIKNIGEPFCITIHSNGPSYRDIIKDLIIYFLKKSQKEVICITLIQPAQEINDDVEKVVNTNKLFFVDAASIFNDFSLPYRNFDSVNKGDLVNDIWCSIFVELEKRQNEAEVIILHGISGMGEYVGVDNTLMFLHPLIKQLKDKNQNIIIMSGLLGPSLEVGFYQNLGDSSITVQ